MLRKMMYDLRSNDAFAYGKQFGRASPLPILQFKPQSGFRHFCQRQKHHFVKQNIIIRLKRIYHFFAIGKKTSLNNLSLSDKLLFIQQIINLLSRVPDTQIHNCPHNSIYSNENPRENEKYLQVKGNPCIQKITH